MSDFKKVLVSCPTAAAKNYCFKEWIDNVMNFTYPNFDIRLFDNTDDKGANANYLNDYINTEYGNKSGKFFAENTLVKHNLKTSSIIAKMCFSHNDCRNYALDNDYDYLLHLESDVFPPKDVIERLMFRQKNITGGLYFTGEGKHRVAMVMERLQLTENYITSMYIYPNSGEIRLFDGDIHQVAQLGLGCVLISRKAMERVKFRYIPDRNFHPDTYFSEDCDTLNIPIHLDSSVVCRHENRLWGFYGLDFT
jgi:cellulose synthase/poly-beta-1,6-N-acetylglucosamine synthase-like glycosyltransferase